LHQTSVGRATVRFEECLPCLNGNDAVERGAMCC
jgi:hypothetical protein